MKKITLKSGHIAYETGRAECFLLGGLGICDECGKPPPLGKKGYLVPVLNHYQCPDCFEDWTANAKFYPEDVPFEKRTAAYFESRIPLDKETDGEESG